MPSAVQTDVLGHSPRGPWSDVPDAQWTDWRWQHRNRLRSAADLARVIDLSPEERQALERTSASFRTAVTPYYAALMDRRDPACPIRRQAVPSLQELEVGDHDLTDPLGEDAHMPVAGLTHRYPDRALLYATHHCPVYCRHCTRKRKVSDPSSAASQAQIQAALAYIQATPAIRDVLVSGGDPLSLSDGRLVALVAALREIAHVETIRLCTRNPVTLPFRFTPELLDELAPHHPLLVHTHFNHPSECTPEAARCLRLLADRGFSCANQMVLLAGINDRVETVATVNRWLLRQRCRPYYLFQADLAEGVSHFRTPVQTGLDIVRGLRGHTSGTMVPHYVIDAPGGGGKVPLVPQYVTHWDETEVRFNNYEGKPYRYPAK